MILTMNPMVMDLLVMTMTIYVGCVPCQRDSAGWRTCQYARARSPGAGKYISPRPGCGCLTSAKTWS